MNRTHSVSKVDQLRGIWHGLKRWVNRRRTIRRNVGGSRFCCNCDCEIRDFLPSKDGLRNQVLCPVCGYKPCHRFLQAWFDGHPEIFRRGGCFLHVAPESELKAKLRRACGASGMRYEHGNISDPTHYLDLEHIQRPDDSVDVLLACHVMNAVVRDRQCLSEIARVIRPGGLALLPVPLVPDGETADFSEAGQVDKRIQHFADPGIMRRYAQNDFIARLEAVGFEVEMSEASALGEGIARRGEFELEAMPVAKMPAAG